MIKIVAPKPIYLNGSNKGVLLLHSFTSTVRDVKALAEFLNQHNYTCYAPAYQGHGLAIDEFLKYDVDDWFNDALSGYRYLQQQGCQHIAVLGVSLGGILSLRISEQCEISACVTMSVASERPVDAIFNRIVPYAKYMERLAGENHLESLEGLECLKQKSTHLTENFSNFIHQTMDQVQKIKAPSALLYGKLDAPIYQQSAEHLYQQLPQAKLIKEYPNTGHLMTLGADKQQLYQDILNFLDENLT